jgi:hypothetical protein
LELSASPGYWLGHALTLMEQRQSFRRDKDPQIAGQMPVQDAKRWVQKKS